MYHYLAKKKKKLAKLTKDGKAFLLTVARFDPSTGEKKDPLTIRPAFICNKHRGDK